MPRAGSVRRWVPCPLLGYCLMSSPKDTIIPHATWMTAVSAFYRREGVMPNCYNGAAAATRQVGDDPLSPEQLARAGGPVRERDGLVEQTSDIPPIRQGREDHLQAHQQCAEGGTMRVILCRKFCDNCSRWETYQVAYYSLDVVLSVGYRVKSDRGVLKTVLNTSDTKHNLTGAGFIRDYQLMNYGAVSPVRAQVLPQRAVSA